MYMTGFFPVMIFGLPGAALAMYHTAFPEYKKMAGGLLLTASICSVLTGVTEPLEFSFMFLAPELFLLHALLTGLSGFVCAVLPFRVGFNFSAGLLDYILSLNAADGGKSVDSLACGTVVWSPVLWSVSFLYPAFRNKDARTGAYGKNKIFHIKQEIMNRRCIKPLIYWTT